MNSTPQSVKNIIKKFAGRHEVFVDFSGGRYSLVLLHLVLECVKNVKAVYIDTTITLPECNEYVNEICDKWGVNLITIKREDTDFWQLVKKRGFPHRRFRWCMQELKSIPLKMFNEYIGNDCLHLTGTTIHESRMRKKIYEIRGIYHFNYSINSYVLHPILYWTPEMVNKYIKKHNLPINPCYSLYGSGGNCYYCPFIRDINYYLNLAKLRPKLFQHIIEAEESMRKGGAAIYLGRGKRVYVKDLVMNYERMPI
ncbi:MAG: phosphoadenosine phosphosulfate reductase family protein [Candidatus Bathyarchaeia archaeon]